MSNLEKLYSTLCANPSDIHEHLPTLRRYASECKSIAEFGTRFVVSTFALMCGKPFSMDSYDIYYHQNIEVAKRLAKEESITFRFIQKSTLEIDLLPVDLLFIDTWHSYVQLKGELFKHGNRVDKYIIMHDTETFGKVNEPLNEGFYDKAAPTESEKQGLLPAIDEFLKANPHWYIKQQFKNNNGLTILKRKNEEG